MFTAEGVFHAVDWIKCKNAFFINHLMGGIVLDPFIFRPTESSTVEVLNILEAPHALQNLSIVDRCLVCVNIFSAVRAQ